MFSIGIRVYSSSLLIAFCSGCERDTTLYVFRFFFSFFRCVLLCFSNYSYGIFCAVHLMLAAGCMRAVYASVSAVHTCDFVQNSSYSINRNNGSFECMNRSFVIVSFENYMNNIQYTHIHYYAFICMCAADFCSFLAAPHYNYLHSSISRNTFGRAKKIQRFKWVYNARSCVCQYSNGSGIDAFEIYLVFLFVASWYEVRMVFYATCQRWNIFYVELNHICVASSSGCALTNEMWSKPFHTFKTISHCT